MPARNPLSRPELNRVWQRLDSDNSGKVTLVELLRNADFLQKTLPALLKDFESISANGQLTRDLSKTNIITLEELHAFSGGASTWLEFEFKKIIGLDSLKQQVRKFHRSIELDQQRRKAGLLNHKKSSEKYHMIFQGNPGTGKTTMGRLIATLMKKIGILPSDLLVEVQRDLLVAEYVGQTAPKTQKVINESKEGILFVDEAYRLTPKGKEDAFGKEAVETLMAAMNEPPGKAPVMVFAGYPNDMANFMQANSGLYRRVAYTFDFPDYDSYEIAQILHVITHTKGFELDKATLALEGESDEADLSPLANIIEEHTLPESRAQMNGGLAERIFSIAKQNLDDRETRKMISGNQTPSITILHEDVVNACKSIKPPPGNKQFDDLGYEGGHGGDYSKTLEDKCNQLSSENDSLRDENARLQGENSRLQGDSSRLQSENSMLKSTSYQQMGAKHPDEATTRQLTIERDSLRTENARLQVENGRLETDSSMLKSENKSLHGEVDALQGNCSRLQANYTAANNNDNNNGGEELLRLRSENDRLKQTCTKMGTESRI
eukprot:GSChrysophyteH2.ASY1.ANO1.1317.1 assembled CDS